VHDLFAASLPLLPLPVPPHFAGVILPVLSLPVVAIILLAAIFVVWIVVRGKFFFHRRREAMHSMASRLGLRPWPDNSLPRGLSLQGTPFFRATKLTNIHEGLLQRNEVVILDFQKRESSSTWSRTVIAVKTRDPLAAPPHLEHRTVGAWQLVYAPVAFSDAADVMDVEGLELLLRNIIR
jgi:hypothetical protein